jgi:hypothetical protein
MRAISCERNPNSRFPEAFSRPNSVLAWGSSEYRRSPGYVGFPLGLGLAGHRTGYTRPRRNLADADSLSKAGLDGPLAQLIPPCADPARLDASQNRGFRHSDGFRGLPQGVTHVLRSVP